jgi:hypothetical protein
VGETSTALALLQVAGSGQTVALKILYAGGSLHTKAVCSISFGSVDGMQRPAEGEISRCYKLDTKHISINPGLITYHLGSQSLFDW